MKYFLTFIMMFFIGIACMAISVDAFSFQQTSLDLVPYMKAQVTQSVEALQAESGFTDNYYIILSYSNSSTYVISKCSFTSSDTVTITNSYWGSPNRTYSYQCRIFSNNPGSIANRNWNAAQSIPGFDSNDNYLIYNTIPVVYNGITYDVPVQYHDDLYITKDGNSIKFGASATLNSRFDNTYFYSDAYTAEFTLSRNNINYTVSPTSYAYYAVGLSQNIIQKEDSTDYLYQDTPYMMYYKYMRSVKVSKYEYPAENPPTAESLTTNAVTFTSDNVVTLNTLLKEFCKLQEDFTIEDMQTEIIVKILNSSGGVALQKAVNFSPLAGTPAATEIPPDEEGTPDQFEPWVDLNATLSTNNYYLKSLLYGDTYLSQGMSDILIYNQDDLNPFDMPEFELENPDFDSDTMTWFKNMVTWWYDTPFGFIAVAALTFLIIRTIVW